MGLYNLWSFGVKKGDWGSVQTKHSYFSMLIVPKCYNASFISIHISYSLSFRL